MKHFYPAIITLVVALILGAANGYYSHQLISDALLAMYSILILSALESSQSMDNSIIAAGLLKDMSPEWQARYKTWGFVIAVLGMRFILPNIIVSAMTGLSPWAAIALSFSDPKRYSSVILGSEPQIMAFGGAFLLMLSAKSLFDHEKETHWLKIEKFFSSLSSSSLMTYVLTTMVTVLLIAITAIFVPDSERMAIGISGAVGILCFYAVQGLGMLVGDPSSKGSGLGSFLYLEAIDASFSFDGVISSFAVSTNLTNNMLGLGVGAMAVRCLTLANVKTGFMADLPYLENGAYLSIFILSILMYLKDVGLNVPDVVTGLIGLVIIGLSFLSSIKASKEA